MKRILILLLAMLSASAVLGQESKKKVAVYTVDVSGQNIVEFVGDYVTNAIVKRGVYTAIERTAQFLKELSNEQGFQRSGAVDDGQISKIGKNMGVHYVCVVKVAVSGAQKEHFISSRLIDVETAELTSSSRPIRIDVNDWDAIEKSCEEVTASLFGERGGSRSGGSSTASGSSRANTQRHPAEPEMVLVQGGTFWMGCTGEQQGSCDDDEKPVHEVRVSNFYIGKYEITQAQWETLMGNNPSNFKGGNLPVENVSWNDAQMFIERLNAATGKQYRLPTEAEWEYAA
jgi:formylglycine-generating enzyme required for sulfatase activity